MKLYDLILNTAAVLAVVFAVGGVATGSGVAVMIGAAFAFVALGMAAG